VERVAGGFDLGPAYVGGAVNDLALEVRKLDGVEIDQADLADTGRGQVKRDG